MIAKYRGIYCNVDLSKHPIDIWTYHPVEGFKKGVTRRGTVYYEKNVFIEELEQIFEPGFSAKWHNKWCGASPLENNEVQLIANDREFAQKYGMDEFERGVFWCAANIDECTEFRMTIEYYLNDNVDVKLLSKEDFVTYYQKFRKDLMPPR